MILSLICIFLRECFCAKSNSKMKKIFDDFETIELKNRELKLAKTLQTNWLVNNIIPHNGKYRTGSIRGRTSIRSRTLIQYRNLGPRVKIQVSPPS